MPHRITDGYGINEHLIDNAAAEGKDTILTCDNGIAAIPQIQYYTHKDTYWLASKDWEKYKEVVESKAA